MKTTRFGVSVDDELLKRFDRFVADRGFPTRSEAIKNLMLEAIAREEWTKGDEVAGSVTFSYDHHKPGVVEKLHSVFCRRVMPRVTTYVLFIRTKF